jgi:hypothetical protein
MIVILLNILFHVSYIIGIFALGFIAGKKYNKKSNLKNQSIITASK